MPSKTSFPPTLFPPGENRLDGRSDPFMMLGNPLRGLNPARVAALLEQGEMGDWREPQWLFRLVCKLDADVLTIRKRRLSAIRKLPWSVKITAGKADALGSSGERLAREQQDALTSFYEGIENLMDAVEFLATAPLCGYAHVSLQGNRLEPLDQWWWLRDGAYGDWYANPDLHLCTAKGAPAAARIDPAQWVIVEDETPLLWIAILKHVRANSSQKWWDKFCEVFSRRGTIITAPSDLQADQVERFRADARAVADGGSGALPGGSTVISTNAITGAGMPYEQHMRYLRETVVLAGTGGLLSSLAGGSALSGGGPAAAHADAFDALAEADAARLSEALQAQIDRRHLAELFPGQPVLAYFQLARDEQSDPGTILEHALRAAQAGYRMDPEELSEATGYSLSPATAGQPAEASPLATALSPAITGTVEQAAPAADVAKSALNGAQISSLVGILTSAASGEIPAAAVWPLMVASFPGVDESTLRQIADSLKGFAPPPEPISNRSGPVAAILNRRQTFSQADLAALERAAMAELGPAFADQTAALTSALGGADSLEAAQAILDGFSADPAIQAKIADIAARTAFSATLRGYLPENASIKLEPLPFKEAQEFWAAKIPVATLDELAPATWAQAQKYGLKVAGLADKALLEGVKADLASAIAGDLTVDEFVRGAEDKYGLNSKHAETVARTNIQTAYQYGHYQRLDKQREAFPIWGFDIVSDQRTSDVCSALEGKAYPANHPIWNTLYPPNHYNCRTTVVPFESVEEAEAQGFTVMDAWPRTEAGGYFMPSEGFSSNIGTVPSLDAAIPGLEEAKP